MIGQPAAPVPHSRVAQILSGILASDRGVSPLPERLCDDCVRTLEISGAALVLMKDQDNLGVVAVTDGPAAELEELQFATGEGPGIDAARTGRPVLQPDLRPTAVTRWPGLGPAALETGIRAIFAFPLHVGAIRFGVLDLYRDTSGYLTDAQLADAFAFADAATLILLHLQGDPEGQQTHPVIDAIEGRAVIHQATGMIAVQLSVSLAEALLRLRAHAYAAKPSMADIAADVVGRRLRFDHSDSGTSIRNGT